MQADLYAGKISVGTVNQWPRRRGVFTRSAKEEKFFSSFPNLAMTLFFFFSGLCLKFLCLITSEKGAPCKTRINFVNVIILSFFSRRHVIKCTDPYKTSKGAEGRSWDWVLTWDIRHLLIIFITSQHREVMLSKYSYFLIRERLDSILSRPESNNITYLFLAVKSSPETTCL